MFFQTSHIPYLATVLVICGLFLSLGCAPKVIIQSPESVPPAVTAPSSKSRVSELLLEQFQIWKGVPHRVGGTDRRGVDCSGLMQIVFRDAFGLNLPRTSREQGQLGRKVEARDMRPGDLVYFEDKGGDHIGVIVEKGVFLHASSTIGVTLSKMDVYWWSQLRRVQRVLS
jgi:cell wall-associated NlpC family hydrolase